MKPKTKAARHNKMATDLTDDVDIGFDLKRLYDPYNMDHIAEEDRLTQFQQCDLQLTKNYKAAAKIMGGPIIRKRNLAAKPMETLTMHRLGKSYDEPPKPVLTAPLKPPKQTAVTQAEPMRKSTTTEDGDKTKYKSWMDERRKLRGDLENMGLNQKYLARKPDKTMLENRVLTQLTEESARISRANSAKNEVPKRVEKEPTPTTFIKMPSPHALQLLDFHLSANKMRLLDLFTLIDQNKDWKLTRKEFKYACKHAKIPIEDGVLDDMIMALDTNLNDTLEYSEISRGIKQWKKERRENKRKRLSQSRNSVENTPTPTETQTHTPFGLTIDSAHSMPCTSPPPRPDMPPRGATSPLLGPNQRRGNKTLRAPSASRSRGSVVSCESDVSLGVPDHDLRGEQYVLQSDEAMVDLAKRTKGAVYRSSGTGMEPLRVIKSGNHFCDANTMHSQISGDTGGMVDKFRQDRLKEYYEMVALCKENNVQLSKKLLEKVLLYPPDKPHSEIEKNIRPPDVLLHSNFVAPQKKAKAPMEVTHKDCVKRTKNGMLLIDSRQAYPAQRTIAPKPTKVMLSTGRATVQRQVDCWMPFEEYEMLTRHLAVHYQQLHNRVNYNAFWPGRLLDKIRLCMPPYDSHQKSDSKNKIFMTTGSHQPRSNYGYDNDLNNWPVNNGGYVQSGTYNKFNY